MNIDLWILCNDTGKNNISSNLIPVYSFNARTCEEHGFTMKYYYKFNVVPIDFYGNNIEYSFMSFYIDHPEYRNYWLIEWDVYFNGDWCNLFSYYDSVRADFISTHIQYNHQMEAFKPLSEWLWIKSFDYHEENRIKCFNPIDRFSNKALSVLVDAYRKGDYGFYEVCMPTIFYNNMMIIQTFGTTDNIEFNNSDGVMFADDDSMRYRPFHNKETMKKDNFLYHPVKQL